MRLALAALCLVLAPIACARETPRDEGLFRGVYVDPAVEKPEVTFTDFNGQPFNFRQATEGKVALLFFGYTHCPDVCPLHAANIAAVLRQMPFEERAKIQFLFVTTDPERDTPERLRQWLGAFDRSFIGLAASPDELLRVQRELRLAPARKEFPAGADSSAYLIGHAAQVIAFGVDNLARTEYPMGVRQEDWARDLPRLARGEIPPNPGTALAGKDVDLAPSTKDVAGPAIQVQVAVMAAPPTTSEAAVYLVLANAGADDTLVGVWSPEAKGAMIHTTESSGGQQVMRMRERFPVAQGATLSFLPGGTHVMLTDLARQPNVGESFPLRLRFARAGEFAIAPMVVPYAELDQQLRPR
jgi:protein SCO1/2